MKTCKKCQQQKQSGEFRTRTAHGRPYSMGTCRSCENEARGRTTADVIDEAHKQPPAQDVDIDIEEDPLFVAHEARRQAREKRNLKTEHEALVEENTRLIELLDILRPIGPAAPIVMDTKSHEKKEAVPIIELSDWHVEENVDPGKVQGLNEYSPDIATERGKLCFSNALRLISLAARDSLVRRIVLGLGGDFITNSLHEESMETNHLGPTYAIMLARDILVAGIRKILTETDLEIDIPCVGGNHGRFTKKMRIQTATENSLEFLLYQFIATEFRNEPRVRMHICSGTTQYLNLFGTFNIRFVHGWEIKYGGGIGGITVPLIKALSRWDRAIKADLTMIHHFHQRFDGGLFLVNGSLIGFNEYAQANGYSPEPPQQIFALINNRHGGEKTIVAPIWCTE